MRSIFSNTYKLGKLYKVIDQFLLNNEGQTREENPTFTRKLHTAEVGDVYMLTRITRVDNEVFGSVDDVWYRFYFLVGKHEFSAVYLEDNDECAADFATCFVEWKE